MMQSWMFAHESANKARMFSFTIHFSIVCQVLVSATKEEKTTRGIQIRANGIKSKFLFYSGTMNSCGENLKRFTKRKYMLELGRSERNKAILYLEFSCFYTIFQYFHCISICQHQIIGNRNVKMTSNI